MTNELNKIDTGPISQDEWNLIKPHLPDIWKMFYQLLFETGIRVSEGLNLKFTDLVIASEDLQELEYTITFQRLKKRKKTYATLYISKMLFYSIQKLPYSNNPNSFIFTGKPQYIYNTPYSRVTAWKTLEKARRMARIKRKLHPHSFRHGFGKRVAEIEGLTALDSLHLVKNLLGLSSLEYAGRYSKMADSTALDYQKRLI